MAARGTLDAEIGVRVPVPQPRFNPLITASKF